MAIIGANGAGKIDAARRRGRHAAAAAPARCASTGGRRRLPAHRRVDRGDLAGAGGPPHLPQPDGRGEPAGRRLSRRAPGRGPSQRVYDALPACSPSARRAAGAATLSGGEQQMLAIGRALMANPRLLLLDEISLGLAPSRRSSSSTRRAGAIPREGTTVVLVEQDISQVLRRRRPRLLPARRARLAARGRPGELTRERIAAAYFGSLH